MAQLPENVYMVVCLNPGATEGSAPSNCIYTEVKSSVLSETTGLTKQQYDELIGAVMMFVVIILIIGLIKKAIEQ